MNENISPIETQSSPEYDRDVWATISYVWHPQGPELGKFLHENEATLDVNKDEFVSKEELSAFLPKTTQEHAVVRQLQRLLPNIQNLSNDEWGRETSGISRKGMRMFEMISDPRLEAKQNQISRFTHFIRQHFDFFDLFQNSAVTIEDLQFREHSQLLDNQAKEAVRFMVQNFDTLNYLSGGGGITKDGLRLVNWVITDPKAASGGWEPVLQRYKEARLSLYNGINALYPAW